MKTYEELLAEKLEKIPSDVNKTEGSLIYMATAANTAETIQMYIELEDAKRNISPEEAAGISLTELCAQNGTFRKGATHAQRKGVFDIAIPLGSRFGLEETTYIVLSNINRFEYILECEQAGEIGNVYSGNLSLINYINGLTTSNLTDILVAGAEEETDDQLRERYRQSIINPPQDGNVAQYLNWSTEYQEIGIAKVFPLWNGGNTVKVAITNRSFLPAEQALVDQFQKYIDPGSTGLGNGIAPLGAKVTITGGTRKDINITANVVLNEGYTVAEGASEAISNYLASIVYIKNSASYMRIGGALLDCSSIADLNNLTVNGGIVDIALIGDEIPVLNSLNLTVVS